MSHSRALSVLRWTWLLAIIVLVTIAVSQGKMYGLDDFQRVVGWLGATTGTMVPMVLLGQAREQQLKDMWPFWVAAILSWVHIALSLFILAQIASDYSLLPLYHYQPLYGFLNPVVLAALGYFFLQQRHSSQGAFPN